jgi:hypothetical protein
LSFLVYCFFLVAQNRVGYRPDLLQIAAALIDSGRFWSFPADSSHRRWRSGRCRQIPADSDHCR